MTGALHALPATPFSALAGLPAPSELPDLPSRRRFAQAVACALAAQPSYEVEVYPADQFSPLLERRALQADWPVIANADTVVLLRPAPLPDDVDVLIAAAVADLEVPAVMEATLRALWRGDWPTDEQATNELIGEAIRRAARAGSEAAEAALHLAEARALGA